MFYETSAKTSDLLAEWRWLIGGHPVQLGWSSSGDLFFGDRSGRISRIDTGSGAVEIVAESGSDFHQAISDAERADELLLVSVVRSYEAEHGKLMEGQCLGFILSPVFGGAYSADNRRAVDIEEHAASSGNIFRQIRDLPDGASVRLKVDP